MNGQELGRLTGRVYDTALGAGSWDSALDDIMQAVGAEVSALFVEDRSGARPAVEVFSLRGYPDDTARTYASYFAERDVRLPALGRLAPGEVYVDDRAMPFAEIERSEIYNDFYRPIGVAHGIAAMPFNDGRRFGIFSAHRAIAAGQFSAEAITLFELLAPHVTRALQLQRQVARANAIAGGVASALDHFPMAVVLADERGEVVELNSAAEALLRGAACPLRIVARRLVALSSTASAMLARAIAGAAKTSGGRVAVVPPILRLAKTDGSGAAGVMVTPAGRGSRLVLVFISDPGQATPSAPEVLIGQFGLSPAEAQVAAQLAAGDRVEDIADARKVSQETVRVQVKRVLSKTATRSQAQLVGLVSRSLAVLRR